MFLTLVLEGSRECDEGLLTLFILGNFSQVEILAAGSLADLLGAGDIWGLEHLN